MTSWRERITDLGAYDQVYFSPHPDDVAFSCPAALLSARRHGRRVLVVTVFTEASDRPSGPEGGEADPPHLEVTSLYELRRSEELEAARRAGYQPFLAGLVDAPFRPPPERCLDFMDIVWARLEDHAATRAEVCALMEAVLDQTHPREVMVPLGIGRHIDHRLVFDAYRHLSRHRGRWDRRDLGSPTAQEEVQFWCYEDRPYALVDQATKMRLRELGFPVRLDPHRFFAAFWSTHYVHTLLTDPRARPPCGARYLESIQGPVLAQHPPNSRVISADDLDALWDVVSAHASQLMDFVGDRQQFEWTGRVEARRRRSGSRYAERQWRLSDTARESHLTRD